MSEEKIPVTPREAVDIAQRALAQVNQYKGLEKKIDDLEQEVTSLKLRLSSFDEDRPYEDLSRDDKIGMVREYAFRQASNGIQKTFTYSDVRDKVFDGEPSPAHCYDLMKWAASTRGFEYKRPPNSPEHLFVNLDEVRMNPAFYSANKTTQTEGVL